MRALATLLHDAPASLPHLRARLFTSATAALRREQQVKTLLRWLYDAMRDPLVVDLPALIARAHLDPAALAREVEHARCRLRAGAHFRDLALPLVRALVPPFQHALAP